MRNKKILIIPIILIILLLLGTGIFAFVYLKTDMFKNPKQLFFKYAGKSFDGIVNLDDYDKFFENSKILSEKSFTSNGEISLEINTDNSNIKDITDKINKAKINYRLSSIPKDKKHYIELQPTYNNKIVTKLQGLVVNDNYGLKCSELYDKYIYVENKNLKSLAKKFGISEQYFPDKIYTSNFYDSHYINKEQREKIFNTYYNLLNDKLDSKKFKVSKNTETSVNGQNFKTTKYSLDNLTNIDLIDIEISYYQALENDDFLLDYLSKTYMNGSTKTLLSLANPSDMILTPNGDITLDKGTLKKIINKKIDSLNNQKSSASNDYKFIFNVYSYKGNTVKLEAICQSIEKENQSLNYTIEITRNTNGNNIISVHIDNEQLLKVDYTTVTKNNVKKIDGTANFSSNHIQFSFESSNTLRKLNIKATLPYENVSTLYQTTSTDDIIVEYNSEIKGELGNGKNTNAYCLSISSGKKMDKLILNSETTYTDNISIDDLNTNTNSCLNTMSASKIETELRKIVINFRKVLPKKLEMLEIDPSLFTNGSNVNEIENNNTNNNTSQKSDDSDVFAMPATATSTTATKKIQETATGCLLLKLFNIL